jgi:putative nucleotidyltransferase with HDIG domain
MEADARDPEELARDRDAALRLLHEWTESEALRRHAYAVEAAVRAYARERGEDEAAWGNVALLHDFDYERHPTLDQHPQDGAPYLREAGYPEWFVRAVLSHAGHLSDVAPRETDLEHVLFACDELAGFVHACALVRPEGLSTLEPKSVRKKLKQKSFAAGVNRDDVEEGARELGVDLDDHIRVVIDALRPIHAELGVSG